MLTAGQVLTAARDRSPDFDPRKHPDATVLRHLSAYQRRLVAKAVQWNRLGLAVEVEVDLPSTVEELEEGITLPDTERIVRVTLAAGTLRNDIELIPAGHRDQWFAERRAWLAEGKLYLAGPLGLWTQADTLTVTYIPTPEPLVDLESEFVLPDSAEPLLIEQASAFLAKRARYTDAAYYQQLADRAEADWLDAFGSQRPTRFYTREGPR